MTDVDPKNEATFTTTVIKSDLNETGAVTRQVLDELSRCGYGEQVSFAVKLALEEALNNAIRHGNAGDASKTVTVRYAVSAQKVVLIVRDQGNGFLPEAVPDCTTPDRLRMPTGRGILLIKAYMDEVCFRDCGREIQITKRRDSTGLPTCTDGDTPVRHTVFFSGRVQGVGFRYTAEQIAHRFAVTGQVGNTADGRVELIVEGALTQIEEFLSELGRAMKDNIEDSRITASPVTGEFCEFTVVA